MTLLLPSRLQPPALLGDGVDAPPADGPAPAGGPRVPALPPLGPCLHQPVLLILLFDNSPAVADAHDVVGNRFVEAAAALDQFRRRCQCRRELVAVRTFDLRTSSDAGPVHLDNEGWSRIRAALATPADAGRSTSRMRKSVLAAEKLAQAHPKHRTTLVVCSDFELLDAFPNAVMERLSHFPGSVHALVLENEPPAALAAGRVRVHRITRDSQPGDVARAVIAALGGVPSGGAVR